MIGHFLKLVWNRRRANALILIELLISFVALSVILTVGFSIVHHYGQPLGFDYENVWRVDLDSPVTYSMTSLTDEERKAVWAGIRELESFFDQAPEIVAASPLTSNVPYSNSSFGYSNFLNGRNLLVNDNEVRPEAMEVLRLTLLQGRWLEPGDEALDWTPAVVTRSYAEALFGAEDPLDRPIPAYNPDGTLRESEEVSRVVGVVENYRKDGEMNPPPMAQFVPVQYGGIRFPPANYVVRLAEGVPAAFEEELLRGIQAIVPGWTVHVSPLSRHRDGALRENLVPLTICAGVMGFLLIMVGLGLIGVLWQNVTRRTDELGLRRALGATAAGIRGLVLGELMALTSVAVAAGALLYVQIPLLRIFPQATCGIYAVSFLASVAVVFLLVALCGLYPSWLATRVQPAAALQYE